MALLWQRKAGSRQNGRRRSLQGQLLRWVLGGVGLLWALATLFSWRFGQYETDELLDSHLAQAASMLIAHFGHDDEVKLHTELQVAPSLHRYAPRIAFQLWHDDILILRSDNAPTESLGPRSEGFSDVDVGGQTWRVFAARDANRETLVMVGERREARDAILAAVLRGMLMPLALALPALAVVVWWMVKRALLPLRRLGTVVAARRADQFEAVELARAPAEVLPVVQALNGLFLRIEVLLVSERRFTADAAHELRTPIAAIRMQAQAAMVSSDPVQRRHALQATLLGCDRASRVIEQLLTLARLEAAPPTSGQRFDLCASAREEMAELAGLPLAEERDLQLEAPETAPVIGQPGLASILLRNLVDNALRYSPPGSVVRVTICNDVDEGAVRLWVEDSGPGLSVEMRQRLGERFFRVTGTQASGSGLGWSIVRRISAALNVEVQVEASKDLGGLRVGLSFPQQPEQVSGARTGQ
jgi:two-component system sensor histidine kinase QseC